MPIRKCKQGGARSPLSPTRLLTAQLNSLICYNMLAVALYSNMCMISHNFMKVTNVAFLRLLSVLYVVFLLSPNYTMSLIGCIVLMFTFV